jgi:hypothetical protein
MATNTKWEYPTTTDPRILRVKQDAGQLNGAAVDMNPQGSSYTNSYAAIGGNASNSPNAPGTISASAQQKLFNDLNGLNSLFTPQAAGGTAGTMGTGTSTSKTTTTYSAGNGQRPSQWTDTTQRPGAFSYNADKPQAFSFNAEKPGQYQAPEAMSPYKSQYTQQLNDLLGKITGRGPFQYDLNSDMLYQNYKDQYMLAGQQAMMDTMGQAQAMTGGYGNSYAQQAGQQAYQQYLTQLNNQIPALYDRAYQRWQDQGNQMLQNYGLYQNADAQDYARYQDTLGQWNKDRTFD